MKSYKSYNIETGEPSDFSPIYQLIASFLLSFLLRTFLFLYVLGLFGFSVSFWLSFAVLFTSRTPFNILIGTRLQKAFNNVAEAKAIHQRYSTISFALVSLLISTAIGFFALRFLGLEVSIPVVLAAQFSADCISFVSNKFLGSSIKKLQYNTSSSDSVE